MNRNQALVEMADQEFDLVIVGAGITGAIFDRLTGLFALLSLACVGYLA